MYSSEIFILSKFTLNLDFLGFKNLNFLKNLNLNSSAERMGSQSRDMADRASIFLSKREGIDKVSTHIHFPDSVQHCKSHCVQQ